MGERQNILLGVAMARTGRIDVRHAPWAEHTLRIPVRDWRFWCRVFPELASRDFATAQIALDVFTESPYADPYRVRSRRAQLGHL